MAVATRGTASNYLQRGPSPSGLADVLDVILDKGLVIDAYVRISRHRHRAAHDRRAHRDRQRRHIPALRRGREPTRPRADRGRRHERAPRRAAPSRRPKARSRAPRRSSRPAARTRSPRSPSHERRLADRGPPDRCRVRLRRRRSGRDTEPRPRRRHRRTRSRGDERRTRRACQRPSRRGSSACGAATC